MKKMVRWILLLSSVMVSVAVAQNSSSHSTSLDPGLFVNPLLVSKSSSSASSASHSVALNSASSASFSSQPSESQLSSSQSSYVGSLQSESQTLESNLSVNALTVSSKAAANVSSKSIEGSSKSSTASSINSDNSSVDSLGVPLVVPRNILGVNILSNTTHTLTWVPEDMPGGMSEQTPVLVISGKSTGMTLCLTGAVHGDELNGIEMIRRIMHDINSEKLTGTIIGVPVANIMGFRRNSRYLPDRRDWNRYFPGNNYGSSASRLARSFFTKVIMNCDALVDIHTGSFHRTNLPQLRADLADEKVAALAQNFGSIAVLNGRGNPNSLRAAAVRAGIPTVTLEAGEPMAMQNDVVKQGTDAIMMLISKLGMYGKQPRWKQSSPVYYKSSWVRANQSGILFSKVELGNKVKKGDLLGTVTDPITNAQSYIKSPYDGRVIGMALDQVVMPGFATHHIGIQTLESILLEEAAPMDDGMEDEDAGDEGMDDGDDDMSEATAK